MNNNLKIRIAAILAVFLVCVYLIIGIPKSKADILANWNNNIHLGLDLRGGSQLVLRVNLQDAFKSTADAVIEKMKDAMRTAMIPYTDIDRNDPQTLEAADSIQINVTGVPAVKAAAFRQLFQDNFNDVWVLTPVGLTDYHITMKPSEALVLKDQTLTSSINTISKKVSGLGLTETNVQKRGRSSADAEIMVQLPGVDDPAHVKQVLQTQAKLELYEVLGGPYGSQDQARQDHNGVLPLNSKLVPGLTKGGVPPEYYLLARRPVVYGQDIRDARAQQNTQNNSWETNFVLSQDAAKNFGRFTEAHANDRDRLAIVLDDHVLSAPTIHSKITDNGVIEGLSGQEEAQDLALNLRAGALPASVEFLEQREVGASLGSDSIREGLESGLAGVGVVVVLMLIYYRRSGINAVLALVLNALILLAALSYFGAVLTLPGIAGLILTVGMAVDSNVLIFERIREELRAGKAVQAAVEAGFNKAFLTIIDTHVTTVISCAMLFLFGTGPVQGFAVTLVIGLVANVFTAVFVSRTIFQWELGGQKQVVTLSI
ncbi:MAG TPA: protein translocase subunit SecD [Bryobacteraceae bacterium]|jgi:preprotein translocase subunit SecD